MIKEINKIAVLNSYLACALWTEELDAFSISDIGASTVETAKKDIDSFLSQISELLTDWNSEEIGHDFWLTRNHHGSGFWDRGYDNGDEITKIAHTFKELNVWKSELDIIYFE